MYSYVSLHPFLSNSLGLIKETLIRVTCSVAYPNIIDMAPNAQHAGEAIFTGTTMSARHAHDA